MNANKKYNNVYFVFFFVFLILILISTRQYSCPFFFITGIPCPLCGMTRAVLNLLHFNFKAAFYYHALWPLLALLPIYIIIKIKNINIYKKIENTICIAIGVLLLTYYIYRHITASPVVAIQYHKSLIYTIYKLILR